jgi:toxin ParE1/3/4
MRVRLRVSARAWADIQDSRDHLIEHDIDAALRFIDAVRETFSMLKAHPRLGPFYEAESLQAMGVRVKHVVNFRSYVMIYRFWSPNVVEVVRVLHTSRDHQSILSSM